MTTRSLAYQQFTPFSTIEVKTWRGNRFHIEDQMLSWTTTVSISQSTGTFSISLDAAHDGAGQSLYDRILPMDYIEIRGAPQRVGAQAPFPIIMRGFVDSVGKSTSFGQTGGPTEPRILINGRNFIKLWDVWQVLYLWTQTAAAASNIALGQIGFGLTYNFGLNLGGYELNTLINDLFNHVHSQIIPGMNEHGGFPDALPNMTIDNTLPGLGMTITAAQTYSGSYWNLLQYFMSPPFGESFVYDTEDGPTLVTRVTPYKTYHAGETPTPGISLPPAFILADAGMTNTINVARSDSDVYTYFLTYSDSTQVMNQNAFSQALFATAPGNGVYVDNVNLFGVRPYTEDTAWINPLAGSSFSINSKNMLKEASVLNQWLVTVMKENYLFESGSMTVPGNPALQVGQYIQIPALNREFYVSAVTHSYTNFELWTTTLTIVRGRPISS